MNIIAIVQARLTSTRLPGKVLATIGSKPLLWHVLNRLSFSKKLTGILVAIPESKENDKLADWLLQESIPYMRGSEEDVLSRYYEAAKKAKADFIVRITSDCPLVDPMVVDQLIQEHLEQEPDYSSNIIKRTFPRGLDAEVFGINILERAHSEAKKAYDREHVTTFIYSHPELFSLHNIEAEGILRRPELRFTVDEAADLELVQKVYQQLYKPGHIFSTKEAVVLMDQKPELHMINKHIKQKPV